MFEINVEEERRACHAKIELIYLNLFLSKFLHKGFHLNKLVLLLSDYSTADTPTESRK